MVSKAWAVITSLVVRNEIRNTAEMRRTAIIVMILSIRIDSHLS
jgi:hypothetical protein